MANARTPLQPPTPAQMISEAFGYLNPFGGLQNILNIIPYLPTWSDYPWGGVMPTDNRMVAPSMEGFTQCPSPVPGLCMPTLYEVSLSATNCTTQTTTPPEPCWWGQVLNPLFATPIQPADVAGKRFRFYKLKTVSPLRHYMHSQFVRTGTTPDAKFRVSPPPMDIPDPLNDPVPSYSPAIDPMQMPVGEPSPDWEPLPYWQVPYRRPNPYRSPWEQPWRGPLPPERRVPRTRRDPDMRKPNRPGRPGPRFLIGMQGVSRSGEPYGNPRPAEKGVKERKVMITAGTRHAIWIGRITEARDFAEALHKAIPKKLRTKTSFKAAPPGMDGTFWKRRYRKLELQNMLKDIYNHFEDLDLLQAISNIVKNEMEDRMYGKAGKYAGRGKAHAASSGYDPGAGGYQLGGRYRPQPGRQDAWQPPDINTYLPRWNVRQTLRAVGWY